MTTTEKFFALLQLGLDCDNVQTMQVAREEWSLLFEMAKQQTLLGVALRGTERLPQDSWPPKSLLLQWIAIVEQIKRRNLWLDKRCGEICQMTENVGLDCCVLKGQGVAKLYPDPLMRQSGDIDLWVKVQGTKQNRINANVKEIIARLLTTGQGYIGKPVYHHLDWCLSDVKVEVHYRPIAFNNPFVNRRFQKWCVAHWDTMEKTDTYNTPSTAFNAIYMLAHLYHHMLFEGVGLRQVMDYYILLSHGEKIVVDSNYLASFRLKRFAGGIMWVLGYVFGLPKERMIVEAYETDGRFILSEIMQAGNFGQYDKRMDRSLLSTMPGRFWLRTKHRWRFVMRYHSEVLWDWPFRLYNWLWRRLYGAFCIIFIVF